MLNKTAATAKTVSAARDARDAGASAYSALRDAASYCMLVPASTAPAP